MLIVWMFDGPEFTDEFASVCQAFENPKHILPSLLRTFSAEATIKCTFQGHNLRRYVVSQPGNNDKILEFVGFVVHDRVRRLTSNSWWCLRQPKRKLKLPCFDRNET